MYIYPDNLSAKATLWLWELRDIGIIGVGLLPGADPDRHRPAAGADGSLRLPDDPA